MDIKLCSYWTVKVEFEPVLLGEKTGAAKGSFDFIVNSKFRWFEIKEEAEEILETMVRGKAIITHISLTSKE